MRSCDGIFSVNWVDAPLAQQEFGRSRAEARPTAHEKGAVIKKARPVFASRLQTIFYSGAKFSRQPLDNTCTASSEKNKKSFRRAEDIHRSGGKLLDNLGLTSRARSGSLHVDWFARSLINSCAAGPLSGAEEKIKIRSEVFRDGHPDSSVRQHQESSDPR
jgi:hypothetical protein